jgi:hypothetical protein
MLRYCTMHYKLGASPQPVESLKVVRLECWNHSLWPPNVDGYKKTLYFQKVVEIPRH